MALYSDVNYLKPRIGITIYDVDAVFQAVFTILDTKIGKRVFRPEFGSTLTSYMFEPCDEITARSILYDISNTFAQEPRVQLNLSKTTVIPVPEKMQFNITIVATVLGFSETERTMNLVLKTKNRQDQ